MAPTPIHHPTLPNTDGANLYFSELAREPDMAELVELFVQELPSRLAALQRAANAHDWPEVGRLAHQLKGASGSHGFPHLASAAASVEWTSRDRGLENEAGDALYRLANLCEQTRAGTPCPPHDDL